MCVPVICTQTRKCCCSVVSNRANKQGIIGHGWFAGIFLTAGGVPPGSPTRNGDLFPAYVCARKLCVLFLESFSFAGKIRSR